MRLLFAGLWTRRAMNLTSLLVCVIAVAAAVLGPMYGRESAEHLLDTRLDERAPYTTGLTYAVSARKVGEHASAGELLDRAAAPFTGDDVKRFWPKPTAWMRDGSGTFTHGPRTLAAPLYWRQGMCDLAQVSGRCPQARDEALMQRTMARTLGLRAGDTFVVTYSDSFLTAAGSEAQRRRDETFRIVGTYRVTDPGSPVWFDLSRTAGYDNLVTASTKGNTGSADPSAPALLVAQASMRSQGVVAGLDRPLDTSAVDLAELDRVESAAASFKARAITDSEKSFDGDVLPDLDLASVFDQVRAEHAQLSRVMVAALAPLVLLTLLLLFALVSTAAQVRRPHVALAKLRGQTRAQVFRFALAEPFLVVLLALPVGVGGAVAAAHLIARGWLHPGIPVTLDLVTLVSLVVVVLAALAASAVAALTVIREPLSRALTASVSRRPPSRFSLVVRSAVVAVAVAAVGNLLLSGDQSSQLLALVTPTFVALALAVGGAALLQVLARAWMRRTAGTGGTASYLASRRLGRRQDVANLMVPLLLAAAVLTFASAATATSDAWRVARAKAEVGAAQTFVASSSPGRLLQVTRAVDPDGRYVAAAVLNTGGDDLSRAVFVDTTRLARVAAWDPAWSDRSLTTLQKQLRGDQGRRIEFTGKRLTVTVAEVDLRSKSRVRSALQLQYVDDQGEQVDLHVGDLRNGPRQQLTVDLAGCTRTCRVEQLYVTGSAVSVSDVQGSLTLESVALDGRTADWGLDDPAAWRPARPFPVSLVDPPVVLEKSGTGLRLRLYLGQLPPGNGPQNAQVSGFARITPSATPDTVPALVATGTRTATASQTGSGIALSYPASTVAGVSLNGQQVPMRVVDRVSTLPVIGTEGSLSDLETALVEFDPPAGAVVTTQLWVAEDTPASVLDAIRAQGITLSDGRNLAGTLRELRGDAFSLGLRLFLIVGVATLLIAVFGVFASAVLQSRWRSYEVASLRVVGVSQRALVRGSVLEYVVLLGVAVLLGLGSGLLALRLVLPSMSLGTAGEHVPAPLYLVHWALLGGAGLVMFLLALVIAVVVSRRITRLGRPSTLRWAEVG